MPSRHGLQEAVAAGRLEAAAVWSRPEASVSAALGSCVRVLLGGAQQDTAHSSVLCSMTLGARLSPLQTVGPGDPGSLVRSPATRERFQTHWPKEAGLGGSGSQRGQRKAGEALGATPPHP